MSKLTDTLKAALEKKKGVHHIEGSDVPATEQKVAKPKPVTSKKPPAKSAGRGR